MKDEKQQLARALDEKAKSQGLMTGLAAWSTLIDRKWNGWQAKISEWEQAKYNREARLKEVGATAHQLSQNDTIRAENKVALEAEKYEKLQEYKKQHGGEFSLAACYGMQVLSEEIDQQVKQQQSDRNVVYPLLERFKAKTPRLYSEIVDPTETRIHRLYANDATIKDDADFKVLYQIACVIRPYPTINVTDETSFKAALWLCEQPEVEHVEIYNITSVDYFKQLMDIDAPLSFSQLTIPQSDYSEVIKILTHYSNRMTVDNVNEFKTQIERFKNVCHRLKLSDENITLLFQNIVNRILAMKDTPEEILHEVTRLASRYAPNFFDTLLTRFLEVVTPQHMSAAIDILKHSNNPEHAARLANRYIAQYSPGNVEANKLENNIIQCLLRTPTGNTQDFIADLIKMRAERISANKPPLLLLMKNLNAETTLGGMIKTLEHFIKETTPKFYSKDVVGKDTRMELEKLLSEIRHYSLSLGAAAPHGLLQAVAAASAPPPQSEDDIAVLESVPSAPKKQSSTSKLAALGRPVSQNIPELPSVPRKKSGETPRKGEEPARQQQSEQPNESGMAVKRKP